MSEAPEVRCVECGRVFSVDGVRHTRVGGEPAWWCPIDGCRREPMQMNETLRGDWSVRFE